MGQTIFVGRDNELKQLNQLLAETKKNLGKMVLVSGEPGAGKTHLVRKFLSLLDNNHLIGDKECVDIEGTNPFSPVKHVLAELHAGDAADTPEQKKKILNSLKAILNDAGTDWIALIPFFGNLAAAAIRTLSAARKQLKKSLKASNVSGPDEIYKIFDDQLRLLAKKKPVIIFLDDLQWTDPSTLNLLFALGRSLRAKPFPLLFIGTYRYLEIQSGKKNERLKHKAHTFFDMLNELRNYTKQEFHIHRSDEWFVEIDVPAFGQKDINDFIETKYPGNRFPGDFVTRLEEITEGNPLFVTGILEFLKKGGDIIESESGGYELKSEVLEKLPRTIEAVIEKRLDLLDKCLRKILDYASVNGENFALQVIEALLKMDEIDLAMHLGELCKIYDLIVPDADRVETIKNLTLVFYCFRHTLVHKYVYEYLDENEKRILHRKIAQILKDLYGEELTRLKEVKELYDRHIQIGQGLIHGFTLKLTKGKVKMDDDTKVQSLLEAAGAEVEAAEQSYEQYAVNECLERAEKALAFLTKLKGMTPGAEEIKFKALFWKSKAQGWLGNYGEAKQTAAELLLTAQKQNSKKNTATALDRLGRENENSGNYDQAIAYYLKALEITDHEPVNDSEKRAEIYINLGWVITRKGNYDQAREYFEKALAISEEANDRKNIGKSYVGIGTALDSKGDYDEAIGYHKKALEISKILNDKVMMAASYNNIGNALDSKGDYDGAIEYHKKALEIREISNDRVMMAASYNNIGNALDSKGDYDGAIEYQTKGLEIREILMDRPGMANCYINIGNALAKKPDYDGAIEYNKKALEIGKSLNDRVNMAISYHNIGNVLYSRGDYDGAIEYFELSLKISEDLDDSVKMASTYYIYGKTMNAKENDDKALEYYEKALAIYKQLKNGEMVERLNELIGDSRKRSRLKGENDLNGPIS